MNSKVGHSIIVVAAAAAGTTPIVDVVFVTVVNRGDHGRDTRRHVIFLINRRFHGDTMTIPSGQIELTITD